MQMVASDDKSKYFSADYKDMFDIDVEAKKDFSVETYVESTKYGKTSTNMQKNTVEKIGKDK